MNDQANRTGASDNVHRVEAQKAPITARLPTDAEARKGFPLAAIFDCFPDALLAIAEVIKAGNDQHNPGQPIHWARGKSMDQDDCLLRHFMDRGLIDVDGKRHSAKMAWRSLALLQLEIEEAKGLPPSRGSRAPALEIQTYYRRQEHG